MVISMYRTDLPEWMKEAMNDMCPYCHSFIADNSDTGATTARWCVNPKCPGHMQHRLVTIAEFFGIKGVGPKTALSMIRTHKFESHFDVIPYWFKDKKPLVTLPDIAVLACIEGYGAPSAKIDLGHYGSFEEYFATAMPANPLLLANKDMLLKAETYFAVKPPLAKRQMWVMGTGSFHGYNSRDEFFKLINEAYGQYVNVIEKGKRKSNISYLIKEYDAVDHSKSAIARECNIPVVTPDEFVAIIASMCPYIDEE